MIGSGATAPSVSSIERVRLATVTLQPIPAGNPVSVNVTGNSFDGTGVNVIPCEVDPPADDDGPGRGIPRVTGGALDHERVGSVRLLKYDLVGG